MSHLWETKVFKFVQRHKPPYINISTYFIFINKSLQNMRKIQRILLAYAILIANGWSINESPENDNEPSASEDIYKF